MLKRLAKLEAEKQPWLEHWEEILDYVMPRKASGYSKGAKRTEKLFDSTAIHANTLLAASLQGTLTSASLPWFSLAVKGVQHPEGEVAVWLEDCRNRMLKRFNASNFNTEVHEFYLDITSIGTACLEVEEDFVFRSLHISEYFLQEDHGGKIDTVYRKFQYTARQAIQRWPETVGEKIKEADQDKKFNFVHCVRPATKEDKTKLPWSSTYMCVEDKTVLSESGYNELPYMVTRWSKASGEEYGRSPAYNALPDIKTLNKAVELGLKAWAKALDPPLMVEDDGVIGRVVTKPGGITVIRRDGALKPLQSSARFDVSNMRESELRAAIKQAFFSDQLELQQGPQMTATEVQVRYELMQRLLGPTLGRFQTEFLTPLINRCFNMMQLNDEFLPAPEGLADREIEIEYVGPLARSQRMEEAVAVERLYEMAGMLAQMAPDIMDVFDHDAAIRNRAELLGVPQSVLRSKEEVQQVREERLQQQQQQAMMQQAQQGVDMASKVAPIAGNEQAMAMLEEGLDAA